MLSKAFNCPDCEKPMDCKPERQHSAVSTFLGVFCQDCSGDVPRWPHRGLLEFLNQPAFKKTDDGYEYNVPFNDPMCFVCDQTISVVKGCSAFHVKCGHFLCKGCKEQEIKKRVANRDAKSTEQKCNIVCPKCNVMDDGSQIYRADKVLSAFATDVKNFFDGLERLQVETISFDRRRTQIKQAMNRLPSLNADIFRMVLPPPNVTGHLDLGHALTITVQDVVARQKRLWGDKVEWIPGFDPARITTQSVVEREFLKKEVLVKVHTNKVGSISSKSSTMLRQQLSRMGATMDLSSREYTTVDKDFSASVRNALCRLHNDGLINEGERFIYWCPKLQTALSDQDVVQKPAGPHLIPNRSGDKHRTVTAGQMISVHYGVPKGWKLRVGTTRPETCFADVGLAVHPEDSRYSHLIGKMVEHPLLNKQIPVVADTAVIREKGTGIVKLTPSHDQMGWQICQRNSSTFQHYSTKKCIDEKGMMCTGIAEFDALDRFEARQKVINQLNRQGRGGKVINGGGSPVLVCSRSGDIIEPRLMRQWYLDTIPLHQHALTAVREKKLEILPKSQQTRFRNWLLEDSLHLTQPVVDSDEWLHRHPDIKFADGDNVAFMDANLWTALSTICKPNRPSEMAVFAQYVDFPALATILAYSMLGTIPFRSVFIHGVVGEAEARNVSKPLGNVVDPLDVIGGISLEKMLQRLKEKNLDTAEMAEAQQNMEIAIPNGFPKPRSDVLRIALLRHCNEAGVEIPMSQLLKEGELFIRKLRSVATYVGIISKAAPPEDETVDLEKNHNNETDKWLLSRYYRTLDTVAESIKDMELTQAFQQLQKFLLADLSDVYLETTKSALRSGDKKRLAEIRATFSHVIPGVLAQLSVFMPFASEVIYEQATTVTHRQSIHAIVLKMESRRLNWGREVDFSKTLEFFRAIRNHLQPFQFVRDNLPGTLFYDSAQNTPKIMPEVVESLCGFKPVFAAIDASRKDIVLFTVPDLPGSFAIKIPAEKQASYVGLLKERLAEYDERVEKQRARLDTLGKIARTNIANEKVRAERKAKDAKLVQNAEAKLQILEEEVKKMRAQLSRFADLFSLNYY